MRKLLIENQYNNFELIERDAGRAIGSERFFVRIENKNCSPRTTCTLEESELSKLKDAMDKFKCS